jgi:DNA-binding NtrC family response regulator
MNEKILIIDHELDIRKNLETILVKKGYHVRTASGGNEAIDIFKSESFALVITEVRMPKLNGLKLIRQFKELDEDIEIIVLTGSATIDNAVRSMRGNGAFDFLTKPLENSKQLFDSLDQALKRHRVNKEKRALLDKLKQTNGEQ